MGDLFDTLDKFKKEPLSNQTHIFLSPQQHRALIQWVMEETGQPRKQVIEKVSKRFIVTRKIDQDSLPQEITWPCPSEDELKEIKKKFDEEWAKNRETWIRPEIKAVHDPRSTVATEDISVAMKILAIEANRLRKIVSENIQRRDWDVVVEAEQVYQDFLAELTPEERSYIER